MEAELDEAFGRWPTQSGIRSVVRGTFPPINVGATPDKVHVYLFAPGLDPSKVGVSIQDNLLTVEGERRLEQPDGVSWYRQERYDGAFRRVIALPDDVLADRAEARYRDGVLQITVARREEVKPRQIEVKAA
jgi:HSP20 family protein